MLKNRFFAALAFAGVLGFAACAEEEAEIAEEPVLEEPAVVEPVAEPVVAPEAGATEILGNGIDDDADGLIDEEV